MPDGAPASYGHRPLRYVGVILLIISVLAVCLEVFLPGGLGGLGEGAPPVADKEGYWGVKTMNVKPPWCEADYHVTHYVAEFWNTMTSLSIIVWGFFGIWLHHRSSYGMEPRFWASFAALMSVGIGSVLFHMTLWRVGQVMDELPMVWGESRLP